MRDAFHKSTVPSLKHALAASLSADQTAALPTAVDTAERPGEHECHHQTPGPKDENVAQAMMIEAPDAPHEQISDD